MVSLAIHTLEFHPSSFDSRVSITIDSTGPNNDLLHSSSSPEVTHIKMSTTSTTTRASERTADAALKLTAGATETGPAPPLPSRFEPLCHPRMEAVAAEVDGFFLQHWPFDSDKARQKFLDAGFSRVTCLYFPKALDDRIHFACRLLTLLFLIDGTVVLPFRMADRVG